MNSLVQPRAQAPKPPHDKYRTLTGMTSLSLTPLLQQLLLPPKLVPIPEWVQLVTLRVAAHVPEWVNVCHRAAGLVRVVIHLQHTKQQHCRELMVDTDASDQLERHSCKHSKSQPSKQASHLAQLQDSRAPSHCPASRAAVLACGQRTTLARTSGASSGGMSSMVGAAPRASARCWLISHASHSCSL